MSHNNHKLCFHRDNTILETIERFGVLDTKQIAALITPHLKYGYKVVQRRMLALYKAGRVRRYAPAKNLPYVYYIDRKPKQIEHKIAVIWGYIYVARHLLRKYEHIAGIKFEDDYGVLRADGFLTVRNDFTGKLRFYFVEADLSNNPFDKVQKYNTLYQNGCYITKDWYAEASRFPAILVLTHRVGAVQRKAEVENRNNLEFIVFSLDYDIDK